jgi:Fic family protein
VNPSNQFVPKGLVYRDDDEKLQQESRNGVRQAEFVIYTAEHWNNESKFTPELLLELQRLAVNQIYRCAGYFRDGPVFLEGGTHHPPSHDQVPDLVAGMCNYVHENWEATPVHLASYLMWRMNWIHPFFGGNGRTARAVSYLALCAKLGFVLPGTKSIPELILEDRDPYYAALRAADSAWDRGVLDVAEMEAMISRLLAAQLVQIHEQATGIKAPGE